MAKQTPPMEKTRTRYTDAYREEALALADRVGATASYPRARSTAQPALTMAHQGTAEEKYL